MFLVSHRIRSLLHSILTEDPAVGPHTALGLFASGQLLFAASNADPDFQPEEEQTSDEKHMVVMDDEGSDEDDSDGQDDESQREHDDRRDDQDEDDDGDDDEPYIPTPERNRILRGFIKSQLSGPSPFPPGRKGPDDKPTLGDMKIECDVSLALFPLPSKVHRVLPANMIATEQLGRILLRPIIIPVEAPTAPPTHSANGFVHPDARLRNLVSSASLNLSAQSLTYTLSAIEGYQGTGGEVDRGRPGWNDAHDTPMDREHPSSMEENLTNPKGCLILCLNGIHSLDWKVLEDAVSVQTYDPYI